ncbi:MFS transporter [Mesorhizobium sp. M7D.F.Ca.US.005.01.1.1]|uniref:MFS transporter n=1 Tax=Mesorhizobium sp. M7D.F.Ca.US.005.01.1.1 TaxID=2493678 RepID=UPI000F764CBA|nr:MFS transporter [Mesorhizobium sp. M7D.F.Ca.US.005.01.1.1]AZO41546.1 MFS transporter [Mesorhizobium sp. M7D.F.Ca.US.005.01.1.1]
MRLSGEKTPGRHKELHALRSAWAPFRNPVFRLLWLATVAANIGGWMYNASAGWLMTSLNADPLMVSLVQSASSLPLFLLALPAGALADIVDQRRFIVMLEVLIAVVSVTFAALLSTGFVTAATLLFFMLAISTLSALEAPAWQSIVPQLVTKEDLPAAVATNSVGINISRALGPALAGIIITAFGIAAPFWLDAFSNVGVIIVLLWWRPQKSPAHTLPAERFGSAIRTGLRYTRNNRHLRATLVRAVGFFLFASAYWALLPLVAHTQIAGGADVYGMLLGAIGLGAVGFSFILPRLKEKLGPNGIVALGEAGTAVTLVLFGLAREPLTALVASLVAGMSWIAVLANLNVSAQVALPDWVRGRGLAMYVCVFFGSMTLGSVVWGGMAEYAGLPVTHFVAAVGALLAIPLTWRWKLQTGAGIDLSPSMHWPAPIITGAVEVDAGPVMITVEYLIDPKHREAFLAVMDHLSHERKRDGAYAWGIFEDSAVEGRYLETFLVESWLEHLRQHKRVTKADRILEDQVHSQLLSKPTVTHFIAAQRGRKAQG